MSTKIGFAPQWEIASVVAINVFGTVITSSPCPIPKLNKAKCKAAVPELTPIA